MVFFNEQTKEELSKPDSGTKQNCKNVRFTSKAPKLIMKSCTSVDKNNDQTILKVPYGPSHR